MTDIAVTAPPVSDRTKGLIYGFLGVLVFSGSLPATRAAVADFDPVFVTGARAVIAGVLGAALLFALKAKRPERRDLLPLLGVTMGVVVVWPLMIAFSLQLVPSAHGTMFIGLLPLMTAIFGVLRGGERPKPRFWLFAVAGSALVVCYAFISNGLALSLPDLFMLIGVTVCGYGYAEGAQLTRRLGGWQAISWALVLGMPLMLALSFFYAPADFHAVHESSWLGLIYAGLMAMLVGFVFWYRGLALGGTASVGLLQLTQPFFSFVIASLFLGEAISGAMIAITVAVVACVVAARRSA
ncbi:MAG TPA: DMT family transporter [Ensifer sp.]|nr:DMT family transporter [Ensifer sp.]